MESVENPVCPETHRAEVKLLLAMHPKKRAACAFPFPAFGPRPSSGSRLPGGHCLRCHGIAGTSLGLE